jgi:hypothetical protein
MLGRSWYLHVPAASFVDKKPTRIPSFLRKYYPESAISHGKFRLQLVRVLKPSLCKEFSPRRRKVGSASKAHDEAGETMPGVSLRKKLIMDG